MIDKTDPTNRDTVPAMLTPGEFVLNKEATEMYGPVIQQMNNAGLQQRAVENKAMEASMVTANMGGGIIPKGYNIGGNTQGLKGLLNFIGSGEGGYDASNQGTVGNKIIGSTNKTVSNGKKLSEMTIDEIIAAQNMTGDNKLFAVGKYQMIPSTFKEVMEGMGVSGDTIFSPDFQDSAGVYLITQKRPKLGEYLNGGDVDEDFALEELAKEFASAPLPYDVMVGDTLRKAGDSRYGSGNKAQHSIQEARDALRSAKISMTGEYPTDPKNYGEYSPEMFLKEAEKFNTPGSAMLIPNASEPATPSSAQSNQIAAIPEMRESPPVFADPSALPNGNSSSAMSFGEAFNQARQEMGAGKIFDYNGNKFSTNFAEEDKVMSANMGGKACSCGKKKKCDCGLNMVYANNGSKILDDGFRLPDIDSDESLLQGSSQSVDDARFKKQIEMQKFMEYQQQQRGIPNNQIPMTYDLETRQMGDPSYRQQASDNELFGGPLNYVNDGPTLAEEIAKDKAAEDALLNAPPAMNVPINPAKIQENPRRDDGLVVSPPPTFKEDVVPFLKRLAHIDDIKSGLTKFDKAFGGVQPVGSVDVNKEYRDLKALLANGDISEGQRRAYEIRITQIEREQDYNKKMEPYSSRNVANTVLEAGNSLATNVDRFVTGKVGETVSGFNPNMGANILDSVPPVYEAPPPRELSQNEIEFNNIRSGKVVPAIDAIGLDTFSRQQLADETRRQQSQINPVTDTLKTKEKVNTALTDLQLELDKEKPVPIPDPDNLPPTEQKDIPEAKSALKDFFGDIFDTKELARAAIMYLGGRATGMSGNQALAFAGKQYINRSDARENTYQTFASSGKYTKPSLALYKKTRDPNSLILKSVPLINMGDPKEYYDTITKRRFIAQKMKDSLGNMIWMMPDGKTPVDFTRTTEDARYVEDSPENKKMRIEMTSRFSTQITQSQDLLKNRTSGENKNERNPYLQIGADKIGKAATKFMLDNGIKEEAMGQILDNVYNEAVSDLKDGRVKEINNLDSYFRRAFIEVETTDAVNFKLKDGEPVSPVSVVSFLNVIRRIGESVEGNVLTNKSDAALSTWLMDQDAYKTYQALPQSDKDKYIQEGMLGKENDRQSGMMVYILKQLAPS